MTKYLTKDDDVRKTVKNNVREVIPGTNFFPSSVNNKVVMDPKYTYCYVTSFDHSKPNGAPSCALAPNPKADKIDNDVYVPHASKMIKSLILADIYDDKKAVPDTRCIMEIDRDNIEQADVVAFANSVNAFNAKSLYKEMDDMNNSFNAALDVALSSQNKAQQVQQTVSTMTFENKQLQNKNTSLEQENVIKSAEITALRNSTVVLVSKDFQINKEITETISANNDSPVQPDLNNFDVGHIIVPPSYNVTVLFYDAPAIQNSEQSVYNITASVQQIYIYKTHTDTDTQVSRIKTAKLYTNDNRGGLQWDLGNAPTSYTNIGSTKPLFSKAVASIEVPAEMRLVLYSEPERGGLQKSFNGPIVVSRLPDILYKNVSSIDLQAIS